MCGCPAGTTDDDYNAYTTCATCPNGNYVPPGHVGACSDFEPCADDQGGSSHPPSTPCSVCGAGHHVTNAAAIIAGSIACSEVECAAGTIDDDGNETTACTSCGGGTYVPAGSSGDCAQFVCPWGTTDDDDSSATPCITCTSGLVAHGPGAVGDCQPCSCEHGALCSMGTGNCVCPLGMTGANCSVLDETLYPDTVCPAGTTDEDGNSILTPDCIECTAGTYAPEGSAGACGELACAGATVDTDFRPTTPCEACPAGLVPPASGAGACVEPMESRQGGCYNGSTPIGFDNQATPRSCTDLWLLGTRLNGNYWVQPDGSAPAISVACDFTTGLATASAASGGGAWTMVASTYGHAPNDMGTNSSLGLNDTMPTAAVNDDIYAGFADLVRTTGGLTDVRFSCGILPDDGLAVDIAFHDVDWVRAGNCCSELVLWCRLLLTY